MSKFNYPETIPRNGLIAEYLLDGNANDTAGSNDGTATDITWITSERGYTKEVASANGTSSKITTNVILQDGYTISFYGFIDKGLDENQTRIADADTSTDDNQFGFRYSSSTGGMQIFNYGGGTFTQVLDYTINETGWYHIVGYFKNGDWKLTINNNTITDNSSLTLPSSLDGINIFISNDNSPSYDPGKIGLVRIYNRELLEKEIFNLYLEGQKKLGPGIMIGNNGDFSKYTPASLPRPILHINGNNNGTTFYDQSGNGYNGTQSGGVVVNQVGLNKEMVFDGSDDYIDFGNGLLGGNCTISLIVNLNAFGNSSEYHYILANDDAYNTPNFNFRIYPSANQLNVRFNGLAVNIENADTFVGTNTVFTIFSNENEKSITLFINGVEFYSLIDIDEFDSTQSTYSLYAGFTSHNTNSKNKYFGGKIYDIKIFNQTLSLKQIEALYYSNYI